MAKVKHNPYAPTLAGKEIKAATPNNKTIETPEDVENALKKSKVLTYFDSLVLNTNRSPL